MTEGQAYRIIHLLERQEVILAQTNVLLATIAKRLAPEAIRATETLRCCSGGPCMGHAWDSPTLTAGR